MTTEPSTETEEVIKVLQLWEGGAWNGYDVARRAKEHVVLLSRQVEELRKALEPFAVYADPHDKVPGNLQITNGSAMARKQLTMSDCYTARAALSSTKPETEAEAKHG